MSTTSFLNEFDADSTAPRIAHKAAEQPQRLRHTAFQKRSKPTGHSGMHRRRNKRVAW
jgi:hypothetical protein